MSFVKAAAFSFALAMTTALPQFAMAQTAEVTVVEISADSLAAITAACSTGDQAACIAAVQAVMGTLAATYPNLSLETLVGALAVELASQANGAIAASNTGLLASLTAAVTAVRTVATNSGVSATTLATLNTVVGALEQGTPVDLTAVAEGTGGVIGAPDAPASNF